MKKQKKRKITKLGYEETETLRIALLVLVKFAPLKPLDKFEAQRLSDQLANLRWYR